MLKRKSVLIKDVTDKGIVVAAFATLNLLDKDNDITLPGYFGEQPTTMLPTHDWSHVPIGKGMIKESGDQAIAEMKMNLEIPAAAAWHCALKFDLENGTPLQEWSYGFTIKSGGAADGEQDGRRVRFLQPLPDGMAGVNVHEVSPVLVGAGEDTMTLMAKSATFSDQLEATLAAVEGSVERAKSLADMRVKQGRGLSIEGLHRIKALGGRLDSLGITLKDLAQDDDARKRAQHELRKLKMADLAIRAGVQITEEN